MERSINTNLVPGVEEIDEELLAERMRSRGHVTVAFRKAIVLSCSSAGATGETSAPRRYFSIRRNETTLCNTRISHSERTQRMSSHLQHVDQSLRNRI